MPQYVLARGQKVMMFDDVIYESDICHLCIAREKVQRTCSIRRETVIAFSMLLDGCLYVVVVGVRLGNQIGELSVRFPGQSRVARPMI